VYRVAIARHGAHVLFEFSASAFLHHMVRNFVGCLVQVGKGARPAQWVAEVLASRDRTNAAPTFGPEGLYLTAVAYPERWQLPGPAPMLALLGGSH
jgi:tRNA pseudouridine38-40 synthase